VELHFLPGLSSRNLRSGSNLVQPEDEVTTTYEGIRVEVDSAFKMTKDDLNYMDFGELPEDVESHQALYH
jgi:hypothetical protein